MSHVNMIRTIEFFIGEVGNYKRLIILQDIHRHDPNKMKGCDLTMLHKVKRFETWIDFLKENGFVPEGYFEAENILVRNSFHSYNPEKPELKERYLEKLLKPDPRTPVVENAILDLSGYVVLEFTFKKIKSQRKVGKKVLLPLRLGETKPDSNDFCKLLSLEAYRDGAFELPAYPKGAEMFECYARLELCPDATNNSGSQVTEYEFEKAKLGEIEESII